MIDALIAALIAVMILVGVAVLAYDAAREKP